MRIIDTHLHLIYLDRFSYPWLSGAPRINRSFPLEDYMRRAEALGIEKAIHMEVDVAEKDMEAETEFVTSVDPRVVAAIAAGRPESAGFPAYLERLAANPRVKGLRRILHTMPDELSAPDRFAENVRLLAGHGLTFDLCVLARQLSIGQKLVDRCPDVQFVLDHCGVPDIEGGKFESWRDGITEIARRPNVAAKISGVIAYGGDDWTVDDLRPYVEHVIDSFGWDRIVWGSDFPVCTQTASLERWVEVTHELIAGASEEERTKLFSANAERIYRL